MKKVIVNRYDGKSADPGKFYGLAWNEDHTARSVYYPIPLNFLIRWMMAIIFKFKFHEPLVSKYLNRAHNDGVELGFKNGYAVGYTDARNNSPKAY